MTSFAFILGVVPLVLAKGAGAEMRQALGIAVFSGMIGVTILGIFFTPVFYVVVRWFSERKAVVPVGPGQPAPSEDRNAATQLERRRRLDISVGRRREMTLNGGDFHS